MVENCLGHNRLGSRAIEARSRSLSSSRAQPSTLARINRWVARHAGEIVAGHGGRWTEDRRPGYGGGTIIDGGTAERLEDDARAGQDGGKRQGGAGAKRRRTPRVASAPVPKAWVVAIGCRRRARCYRPAEVRQRPTESRNGAPSPARSAGENDSPGLPGRRPESGHKAEAGWTKNAPGEHDSLTSTARVAVEKFFRRRSTRQLNIYANVTTIVVTVTPITLGVAVTDTLPSRGGNDRRPWRSEQRMSARETMLVRPPKVGTAEHEFPGRLSPRPTRRPLVASTEEFGGADAKRRRTPAMASAFMHGENFSCLSVRLILRRGCDRAWGLFVRRYGRSG